MNANLCQTWIQSGSQLSSPYERVVSVRTWPGPVSGLYSTCHISWPFCD